jgi:nucleoside-diphosphate-sugar epimerase
MPARAPLAAVTGAFSYAGSSIAAELLARGWRVRTLTGHPGRAPSSSPIETFPLDFTDVPTLRRSLAGVDTLVNTYWIRFPLGRITFDTAVDNSVTLFAAAREAGVRRIVHVSITNPDPESPYPYFRGKAEVEAALARCGVPCAVARPAFLFGRRGVLINNVAWALRHLPAVPVGDGGTYFVRGIHVDDLAALCVDLAGGESSTTVDAVGPQRMTFRELLEQVRDAVAPRTAIVSVQGPMMTAMATTFGLVLRDRILTTDEYRAMQAGLADSAAASTGRTRFDDWLHGAADGLGRRYLNDSRLHGAPAPAVAPQGRLR